MDGVRRGCRAAAYVVNASRVDSKEMLTAEMDRATRHDRAKNREGAAMSSRSVGVGRRGRFGSCEGGRGDLVSSL